MATMLHDTMSVARTSLGSIKERAEHALDVAKRKMGPLVDQAEHALHDAKDGLDAAREYAEHQADAATNAAESVTARKPDGLYGALATAARGIGMLATVTTTLRKLSPDRGIPWLESTRRRSTASSAAIFGAGVLTGAGAAVLLTPMTGPAMRRTFARQLEIRKQQAIWAIDQLGAKLQSAQGTANDADAKTYGKTAPQASASRPYDDGSGWRNFSR